MHVHFLDPFRPGQSLVHRADPRVKFVLAVAFIFTTALTPPGAWPVYILLAGIVLAVGMILFQALAGWLGQMLLYRMVMVILSAIGLVAMFVLIWIPAKDNRPIYEATRKAEPEPGSEEIVT